MRNKMIMAVCAASMLALAGCGSNPGERAVTGGLIGAGAGAAIGAAAGNPAAGALVGGAVGAIGGAATSPCDVDLDARDGHRHCDRDDR